MDTIESVVIITPDGNYYEIYSSELSDLQRMIDELAVSGSEIRLSSDLLKKPKLKPVVDYIQFSNDVKVVDTK